MIDQNTKIIMSYRELEFHDKQIREDAIEEFCEQYKNFQSDEGICDLQEDCSISGGWCIDCFKDKWLKEQKDGNSINN